MSYINNMNPRRMIWFNQNAPKNKMDLWLSYNQHYEDTEDLAVEPQQTTDNPSQRKCDLILKAWDCGQWVPIVGFNSTAANKIDTVEGNTLYHPAIFTGENPNDLYDAGTLGSLLSNPNFVTEKEWHNVFNSSNYDWGDIFGDAYWFGDLIWETIQGGSGTYHLPWATTEVCGGILSDTHTYDTVSAFKPIEVKFYPSTNAYSSKLHRLCVSASDVIDEIEEYFLDNPGVQPPVIPYDPSNITEVLEGILKNTSSIGRSIIHTSSNPNAIEFQIYNVHKSNAGKYLRLKQESEWPENEPELWNQLNCLVEWADLPSGSTDTWRPITGVPSGDTLSIVPGSGITIDMSSSGNITTMTISSSATPVPLEIREGNGISITSGNTININTENASSGQVLTVIDNSGNVEWRTITTPGSYNGGFGIDVSGNTISIETGSEELNGGEVLSNDGSGNVKWVNTEYHAGNGVRIDNSRTIYGKVSNNATGYTASSVITVNSVLGTVDNPAKWVVLNTDAAASALLNTYSYNTVDFTGASGLVNFALGGQLAAMQGDPVYMLLNFSNQKPGYIEFNCSESGIQGKFIDSNYALFESGGTYYFTIDPGSSGRDPYNYFLITMQFGIVRVERLGVIPDNAQISQ